MGKKKIDVERALDLKFNHGLSNREIAEYFSCNPGSVSERLKSFVANLPTIPEIQALDSSRLDLLKGTYYANLSHLSHPDKLKAASLNNIAYSVSQLHTQLRLEEGKSTSNINLVEYFARIREKVTTLQSEGELSSEVNLSQPLSLPPSDLPSDQ